MDCMAWTVAHTLSYAAIHYHSEKNAMPYYWNKKKLKTIMKLLNITALGLSAFALSLFSSCIDDKTVNADTNINVIEFENIESS